MRLAAPGGGAAIPPKHCLFCFRKYGMEAASVSSSQIRRPAEKLQRERPALPPSALPRVFMPEKLRRFP
jgi:hypothetical protein